MVVQWYAVECSAVWCTMHMQCRAPHVPEAAGEALTMACKGWGAPGPGSHPRLLARGPQLLGPWSSGCGHPGPSLAPPWVPGWPRWPNTATATRARKHYPAVLEAAPVVARTLCTAHCTLHTAHCTLHTAHCTMHTAHCTVPSSKAQPVTRHQPGGEVVQ